MDIFPAPLMILLFALPFLGLGIIAVVLFSLAANRDRWLLPALITVLVLVSTWSAGMEFGPSIKARFQRPTLSSPSEGKEKEETAEEEETKSTSLALPSLPRGEESTAEEKEAPTIIPLVEKPETKPESPSPPENKPLQRREYRVSPRSSTSPNLAANRSLPTTPSSPPAPAASAKTDSSLLPPSRTPPASRPETRPPPPPEPKPEPKPQAKNLSPAPPPQPPPSSGRNLSSATGGKGTLIIKFTGTIVENAPSPSPSPHLGVILDGKEVQFLPPTNVKEQYIDNDPAKGLSGVLYTWENLTVTFSGLEEGFHFLMVDVSLDDPGRHQSEMVGAGREENDYNGTIEIKAGETTIVEFGGKNFMSGKLRKIR